MTDRHAKPPIAYTLEEAAQAVGIGISTLSAAIDGNELVARYVGPKKTKPVIQAKELDRWLDSLPSEKPEKRR